MRVVITRSREDGQYFADRLRAYNLEPIILPTITIEPSFNPDAVAQTFVNLDQLDWLIFTSANGTEAFFTQLEHAKVHLASHTKIAVIGPKTRQRLLSFGHQADFVPAKFLGENIPAGLGNLHEKRVLLPTTQLADPALADAFRAAGAITETLIIYRTLAAEPDPNALAQINEGVDVITFASGSSARYFFEMVSDYGLDPFHLPKNPAIACIGPKTASIASELGFSVTITADPYTVDGLISAIMNYRKEANV